MPRLDPALSSTPNRSDELRNVLREAGLADRVRVGWAGTAAGPNEANSGSHQGERQKTGAEEESFSPDTLLRPTSRSTEGRLIELSGELSSGKTALAQRAVAGATQRGELVAWIDLPNALDPRFLLRAGAVLERVLWARPPALELALRAAELALKAGFALVVLDLEGAPRRATERLGPSIWTRFLRLAREGRATLLLLDSARPAGSFSTLALRTHRERALFDAGLFEGLACRTDVLRNRSGPSDAALPFRIWQRPRAQTTESRTSAVTSTCAAPSRSCSAS